MPEHTNGPWRAIHPILDGGSLNVVQSRHAVTRQKVIARVEDCSQRADTEANARLIAAAPELLEAADYLLSHDSKDPDDELDQATYIEAWEALKVAAYKARGEESE